MIKKFPRFAGDISPNIDNYDQEYVRLAKFLDKFLPKEKTVTYKAARSDCPVGRRWPTERAPR